MERNNLTFFSRHPSRSEYYSDENEEEDEDETLERERLEALENRKKMLAKEAERLRTTATAKSNDKPLSEEEMFKKEAEAKLGEMEENFNEEAPLETRFYAWHDKYRPRKPRFFNRIRTGYEWNKYNQTHYDRILLLLFLRICIEPLEYLYMYTQYP